MLYDYTTGQLSDTDRVRLMDHLSACRVCSDHLQRIQMSVRLLAHAATKPSDRLSPEYWKGFSREVETRLRDQRTASVSSLQRTGDWIEEWVLGRRRTLAFTGGALAIVVLLSFFVKLPHPAEQEPVTHAGALQEVRPAPPSAQVHQYLRRSRALLVGLEHMEVPAARTVDLQTEQKLSRELLQQARDLQGHPMDLHTSRLVGDVERVLIEIATTDDAGPRHVETIRSGIRQENLLFKLRMAEAAYMQAASARGERP